MFTSCQPPVTGHCMVRGGFFTDLRAKTLRQNSPELVHMSQQEYGQCNIQFNQRPSDFSVSAQDMKFEQSSWDHNLYETSFGDISEQQRVTAVWLILNYHDRAMIQYDTHSGQKIRSVCEYIINIKYCTSRQPSSNRKVCIYLFIINNRTHSTSNNNKKVSTAKKSRTLLRYSIIYHYDTISLSTSDANQKNSSIRR